MSCNTAEEIEERRPLLCVHAYHHFAVIIIKAISLWKAAKGKKMSIFSPVGLGLGTSCSFTRHTKHKLQTECGHATAIWKEQKLPSDKRA